MGVLVGECHMPKRKACLPSPLLLAQQANHVQRLVNGIIRSIDKLPTTIAPQQRAELYEELAHRFRGDIIWPGIHMYGRAIDMYAASLTEYNNAKVRGKLATLLINLYGEVGIERARAVLCSADPQSVVHENLSIQAWIVLKQGAIDRHRQKDELEKRSPALKEIVGESSHVLDVCQQMVTYANTPLSALITGPTGSGKELMAKALHACSPRKDKPFVTQNCASIPDELFESDLFGYAPGAFTGAHSRGKASKFERAHTGTLFLDEVGELSLRAQALEGHPRERNRASRGD
jgi:hypothetical protein